MKALVTGGAGFIGGHVGAELVQRGWDVVMLDADATRRPARGTRLQADCASTAVLQRVRAAEFDAVVHLAAIVDTMCGDDDLMRSANTAKALELADAARDTGSTFVYASSASVYGAIEPKHHVREGEVRTDVASGPLNAYARSKLALDEAMLGRYGHDDWPWTGLRFTNVFGTGEEHKGAMASYLSQMLRAAVESGPIRLFADTLHAARDWVPVGVLARRIAVFLEHPVPAGVCNMGSGIPIEFGTLLEWCEDFAGARPELELAPNPCAGVYQYWTAVDMTRWQAIVASEQSNLTSDDVRGAAAELFATMSGGKSRAKWNGPDG